MSITTEEYANTIIEECGTLLEDTGRVEGKLQTGRYKIIYRI